MPRDAACMCYHNLPSSWAALASSTCTLPAGGRTNVKTTSRSHLILVPLSKCRGESRLLQSASSGASEAVMGYVCLKMWLLQCVFGRRSNSVCKSGACTTVCSLQHSRMGAALSGSRSREHLPSATPACIAVQTGAHEDTCIPTRVA